MSRPIDAWDSALSEAAATRAEAGKPKSRSSSWSDPAALDAPVDDDEKEEAREKLVAGPTQDPLKLYVRQIGDGPLLTAQEERELARRKDEGDEEAKKKLIESNLRLVMSITRNYVNSGVPCST